MTTINTTTPAAAPLGNCTVNPYGSIPTTDTSGNLPTLPAFTKIGHILRDRVAISPPPKLDPLARQQAIENALSTALWHIRKDSSPASIQRATGRAMRAASMLKQACTESTTTGRA